MVWLILGSIGLAVFLLSLVLVPVYIGAMTIKEMLRVFTIAIAATAFLYLASWAFVTGFNQVFG